MPRQDTESSRIEKPYSQEPFSERPMPTGARHKTFDATEQENVNDNSTKIQVLPGRTDPARQP